MGLLGPMGLRAFGAIGDMGLSMFWSLGQTGLRTVGTKGSFEALGHVACMGLRTSGVPYYAHLLCHTISYYAMPYYSINRDTRMSLLTSYW